MKLRLITFLSLVYLTQLGAAEIADAQENLIKAVEANDPNAIWNALLDGAIDLKLRGSANPRIMHLAVIYDADKAIEALKEWGWDINVRDDEEHTPLYYALFYDKFGVAGAHPRLIPLLIKNGATIDGTPINLYDLHDLIEKIYTARFYKHGPTIAAQLEALRELLKAGAPVNFRDDYNSTPLHDAARFNDIEAINLLASFGADLNAHDIRGDTPMHKAISFNAKKALIRLLELGAEADERDNAGQTPREYAQALCKHDLAQTTGL